MVEHNGPAAGSRCTRAARTVHPKLTQLFALPEAGDRRGSPAGGQVSQRSDAVRTAHEIGDQPCVALEFAERLFGCSPEDAIGAAGVEAEGPEPELQLRHIIAAQEWLGRVEEAVTEVMFGFLEGLPGFQVAVSGRLEPADELESPDGVDAAVVVVERRLGPVQHSATDQQLLEVADEGMLPAGDELDEYPSDDARPSGRWRI